MNELSIFKNISEKELNELLKSLSIRKITIKKDHIIFSNLVENDLIGVIIKGTANIVKYDYFGNRNIVDNLEYDSIFGKPFSYINSDVSIIATSDCEILLLDYSEITNHYVKYKKINNNINEILTGKINKLYERVEILSKRSIRDKLLCYFDLIAKKRKKKSFILPITYIELADYLSVDRSAMMREIKKLKEDGVISSDGKKIFLNY